MKKENILVLTIGLFVLAYVLDYLAGPVSISIRNPLAFLKPTMIGKYPFTAVAIGIRTTGLFLSIILAISIVGKKYFAKAASLFFLGALLELYTIQQLATGMKVTPVQWTLSFGFSAILLIIPIIFYIFRGLFSFGDKKPPVNPPISKSTFLDSSSS